MGFYYTARWTAVTVMTATTNLYKEAATCTFHQIQVTESQDFLFSIFGSSDYWEIRFANSSDKEKHKKKKFQLLQYTENF